MFGDGKWRMIDSLGSSALIGGGEKERGVGMRELCGSHCLKIPRFAPVRVEALPFHRLVHRLVSLLLAPLFSVRLKLAIN